ncbi:MAG: hypothetical protein HYR94_02670, partial [Chloroflexi bacterium]|nr:hypothetical protein [Chloroflexota bacterium]
MDNLRQWGVKLTRRRWIFALVLVILGLVITTYFGLRAVRSFQQLRYIHEQGLDRGIASVDAIRPWMTIRFIAVAYAVPEEYLYSALAIPFERRNADQPLGELNRIYHFGLSPNSTELAIIDKARAAITAYRANPVATGLRDVRPWMSVRYIANSTGVPVDYIFKQLSAPRAGNEDKPLDLLSDEL